MSQVDDFLGVETSGAFEAGESIHSDLDELHTDIGGFEEIEIGLDLILRIEHSSA